MLKKFVSVVFIFLWGMYGLYAQEWQNSCSHKRLEKNIKTIIEKAKQKFQADDVIVTVYDNAEMEQLIAQESQKASSYSFEPGSVMMPVTLAIALKNHIVTPDTSIDIHNGKIKIDNRYTLQDNVKFKKLSATDVVVFGSNVGIAQIGMKIPSQKFLEGLKQFGIEVPNKNIFQRDIGKALLSYGYGFKVTPSQLLQVYVQLINDSKEMQQVLLKSVKQGNAKNAAIKDLIVGGKGSTSHIIQNGRYTKHYNSSFYGFVKDKEGNSYTIGVVLVDPKVSQFQSYTKSAIPVFKEVAKVVFQEVIPFEMEVDSQSSPSRQYFACTIYSKKDHHKIGTVEDPINKYQASKRKETEAEIVGVYKADDGNYYIDTITTKGTPTASCNAEQTYNVETFQITKQGLISKGIRKFDIENYTPYKCKK